ncbi:thioredoxin-disulfide reductase [Peptacetobacter hominis]|uniref:Thioredoxin reductase n=1 Tax=Peptacetobacter hominis TaxID=2743610 RepID=A0A544QYR9_9FIRM|nr:thioredoxin-disulfide reductase [Peptacetobacter hominis]TQQ85788.1 thioredoxin-disulfide reductase [Peptacetobacter hominis]
MENVYDIAIIGAGPAGLAAGLYGARAKMKTVIFEKSKNGGQIVITHEVANYPGSVENASGPSLVARMVQQCKEFGAEIKRDDIVEVQLEGDIKVIKGQSGEEYRAKAVVVAAGASPRKIGCPGEKEFTGKGVSYCATCDADFFEDFEVFVVGGGDSAIEEAMYLTKFARKVTIVHRRQGFRCAKSIEEKAKANPKIEFLLDTVVEEIKGDGILESVVFKNVVTGETFEYHADEEDGTMGVFVFIGVVAQTDLYKGIIDMNEQNYIITDDCMRTNIPGVFAAGDCRVKPLRQVVTATADGAIAAVMAEKYINEKFGE